MSKATSRADASAEPLIERYRAWIAAVLSALLHLLLLWLAVLLPPVSMRPPQGGDSGGTMLAEYIGLAAPEEPVPAPATAPPSEPVPAPRASPRTRATRVARADEQEPPPLPARDARARPPAPAATPPAATARRARVWGQPPGMLRQDTAPVNTGPGRGHAADRGTSRAASSGPSLDVGGYQVYYDQRSETRLRAWRDQGMTELFMPLPGTRQLMVCPLEIALRRESGQCRLVDPDDPQLAGIGDAREVIDMKQVYRRGELVWRGPGPYR